MRNMNAGFDEVRSAATSEAPGQPTACINKNFPLFDIKVAFAADIACNLHCLAVST